MSESEFRPRRVLITGSAGVIGRLVSAALLERGHFVRGFDRLPTPDVPEGVIGNICDGPALRAALEGIDTLVHLATATANSDFLAEVVPNNIAGPFTVLEAARLSRLRRVILASSTETVWTLLKPGVPVTLADGIGPRNLYAAAKLQMEAMGQLYAAKCPMSVITVRIGWCPHDPLHIKYNWEDARAQSIYLSHRDAGRFFVRAVEAEDVPFALVFAASASGGVDLAPAKELLGYEPMDAFPDGCVLFPTPEVLPGDPDVAKARPRIGKPHSSDRFP